jgi:hypothetical protein
MAATWDVFSDVRCYGKNDVENIHGFQIRVHILKVIISVCTLRNELFEIKYVLSDCWMTANMHNYEYKCDEL